MVSRSALITGITGQDGSYLAELLLSKGYEVHGIIRRSSSFNTGRIDHLLGRLHLHYGDLLDGARLHALMYDIAPDEVYNLGSQSHVKVSFDMPDYTTESVYMGTLRLLEAVRSFRNKSRFYQASSSEMFGSSPPPQNELTRFHPRSPYGAAKAGAFYLCQNYREAYGMHISNGILFNHESPRRGETFVTRKVCKAAARIKRGLQSELLIGNLEAKRDWGFAGDYVEAMWLMLQQDQPDDYVIATGEMHSVRELCEVAFNHVGLDYREYVRPDPAYYRPSEVDALCGDASKAAATLGWAPRLTFKDLVTLMVTEELEAVRRHG